MRVAFPFPSFFNSGVGEMSSTMAVVLYWWSRQSEMNSINRT